MSDETEASEPQGTEADAATEPEATEAAAETGAPAEAAADTPAEAPAEPESTEVAVPEPAGALAVPTGPVVDAKLERRKSRLYLPFLLPIGAILVVAFFTLNISRVFIVASEGSKDLAVLIASGITLAILVGATLVAAMPQIRTSSLVIGMAGLAVVVMLAGSLVLGASLPESEAAAGYVEPAGEAINTLEVDALPELAFQAKRFEVPGGINLIRYIDKGGTHTLLFDENAVPGFLLAVPVGKAAAKVDLTAETTYTIYCNLPGHREAGMEADVVVGAAGGTPEPGTETPTETTIPTTDTTIPAGGADPSDSPASQSNSGE